MFMLVFLCNTCSCITTFYHPLKGMHSNRADGKHQLSAGKILSFHS